MADDIRIEITGDGSDIKKVVKQAEKLVKRFEKTQSKATQRRLKEQKKTSEAIERDESKKNAALQRMERRLSRRRARNRLKRIREEKRAAQKIVRDQERIQKRALDKQRKLLSIAGGLVGFAGVAGIVQGVKEIARFDSALIKLAGTQDLSVRKQMELREAITGASLATAIGRETLLSTITEIVDKSGDIDLATQNVDRLGQIIQVVGEGSADSLGELIAALSSGLSGTGTSVFQALEVMISQGDKGNIVLQDMARNAKKSIGAFTALGLTGKQSFAEYQALLQSVGGILDPAEAVTAVKGFFRDIRKKSAAFRNKLGIEIYADKDKKELKPIATILQDIVKQTDGSFENLKKIGDISEGIQAVFDALNVDMKKNNGELKTFNNLLNIGLNSSDNIDKKFQRISESSGFMIDSFATLREVFTDDLLKSGLEAFTESFQSMNKDDLRELRETFQAVGKAVSFIVKALTLSATGYKRLGDLIGGIASRPFRKETERGEQREALLNQLGTLAGVSNKTERIVEQMRDIAIQLGDLNVSVEVTPEGGVVNMKNSDIGFTAVKENVRRRAQFSGQVISGKF